MHAKKPSPGEMGEERLAKVLADLVEIFRQGKSGKDFQWWNNNSLASIFSPCYGYSDGQRLFDEVVQGVLKLNPDMLSESEVQLQLKRDFLVPQTAYPRTTHLSGPSLVTEAKQYLTNLITFRQVRNVDFPISNLLLDEDPYQLGYVTFIALTQEELEEWKQDKYPWFLKAPDFRVVARVKAPGDLQKAKSYAKNRVDETMDTLRAFCFPFGSHSDTWQIGVVGDGTYPASTPMRIDGKTGITQLGPGIAHIELRRHILSKLEQRQWELVTRLIQKTARSNMEEKLLMAIHWLAESTKPDANRSRFAKVSIALEALIGGEPRNDEKLSVRGITAMLAERAAFLVGKDPNDRLEIDKTVREYYGLRSQIFHEGGGDISFDQIDGFGKLVRRIAISLLEKLDDHGAKLNSVNDLEHWVRKNRYGMADTGN